MPTNKQRREAARRKLERQLAARIARERRRRRIMAILTGAGVVIVAAAVIGFIVVTNRDDKKTTGKSSSSSSSSRAALPARKPAVITTKPVSTKGPCKYTETAAALKSGNLFKTGLPPDPKPTPTKTYTALITTNLGAVTVQLNGAAAPCNVQSLVFLIGKKYFDNTACPRSVNKDIYVVQCGDPSATTASGPEYTVKDENLTKASYKAGVIAMANAGTNTNGSQFFFITKDSPGLPKNYTVVGKVTSGLAIVQKIATGGDDGSNQAGGGRPNTDFIFKTVRITKS